jgi:AcrR family transcriptional regulator
MSETKSAINGRFSKGKKAGEITRERILDAAEELFACQGFDGTSMRDVAQRSESRLALVTYHFGTKDVLFNKVIERRASFMAHRRIQYLDEVRNKAEGGTIPVSHLIQGYVWPFVERSVHGGPGWKNYAQLIARLANSPSWASIMSDHYDAVARHYLIEFKRTLSDAPEAELYFAFSFMVATMLGILAEPGRVENLSNRKVDASNLEEAYKVMVPFLAAGFAGLGQRNLCESLDTIM